MGQPPLSPADAKAALDALSTYKTVAAAATALGFAPSTLASRIKRARSMHASTLSPPPAPTIREPLASFEEAWHQWQRAIGMAKDRYAQPVRQRSASDPGRAQKILVIPDLHAPFHEPEMFAAMLEAEADADVAICIGDLSDSYALSTFVKYDRMPFSEEWAAVTLAMQEIANRFPRVIVVFGNHDGRFEKRIPYPMRFIDS